MTVNDGEILRIVKALGGLQEKLRKGLAERETSAVFNCEEAITPSGISRPCVLQGGTSVEKAAVLFTHSNGDSLPPAATERNTHLTGHPYNAVSVSVIVHPRNPHVPTAHMNLRFFMVQVNPVHWHFGGGFDLTPHIPYLEDAVEWHERAREACGSVSRYLVLKRNCDDYFRIRHRDEQRGIGGIFFDDLSDEPLDHSLQFALGVGETFLRAYLDIFDRRVKTKWTADEEEWMLIRRGRYAEFNLFIDRGTRYGLESGRSVESVLASLPPRAQWQFKHAPKPGSVQDRLLRDFLVPRDWLQLEPNDSKAIKSDVPEPS